MREGSRWITAGLAMLRTAVASLLAWLLTTGYAFDPPWQTPAGVLVATSLAGLLSLGFSAGIAENPGSVSYEWYRAAGQAVLTYLLLWPVLAVLGIGPSPSGWPSWTVLLLLVVATALPAPLLRQRPSPARTGPDPVDPRLLRAVRERTDLIIARLFEQSEVRAKVTGDPGQRRALEETARIRLHADLGDHLRRSHGQARYLGAVELRRRVLRAVPAAPLVRLARHPLYPVVPWVCLGVAAAMAAGPLLFPHRTAPAPAGVVFPVAVVLGLLTALLRLRARPHVAFLRDLAATPTLRWGRVPGVPVAAVRRAQRAEQDLIDGIVQQLRHALAGQLTVERTRGYALVLPELDVRSLGEPPGPAGYVRTAAIDRIEWFIATLAQASIGVSGPRGVGKSTLLRQLCGRNPAGELSRHLTVFVPAPTSYDRREFLVHLFRTVCEEVLRAEPPGPDDPAESIRPRRWLGPGLVALGALVAVLAFGWELVRAGHSWVAGNSQTAAGLAGLLLAFAGLVVVGREAGQRGDLSENPVLAAARDNLRMLRFQRKDTTNRTAGLKLPAGAEFGGGRGREHTELLRGYPELVGDLREFLALLSQTREAGGKVVIGIDELDKIDTAEQAERFLNDLKSIFGVPGCYFLVSVSEDALARFDLRALTVRSAFDSAFDEVLAAPRLDLGGARALLAGRGLVLPEPFLWLCHSLSAGLPRDLLRTVLDLLYAKEKSGSATFVVLAGRLIAADLRSVVDGQLRRIAALTDPTAAHLTGWLAKAINPADAHALIRTPPPVAGDAVPVRQQSLAYLTYLAAVAGQVAAGPEEWRARTDEELDLLARARGALALDPELAVALTKRFSSE